MKEWRMTEEEFFVLANDFLDRKIVEYVHELPNLYKDEDNYKKIYDNLMDKTKKMRNFVPVTTKYIEVPMTAEDTKKAKVEEEKEYKKRVAREEAAYKRALKEYEAEQKKEKPNKNIEKPELRKVNHKKIPTTKKVKVALTGKELTESMHKFKYDMIEYKAEIASGYLKDWSKFSRDPDSEQEIILRELITIFTGYSLICNAFLSAYYPMSEALLDDIIFIQSGLFKFDTWNDKAVSLVLNHVIKYGEEPMMENKNKGLREIVSKRVKLDKNKNPIKDENGNKIYYNVYAPKEPEWVRVTKDDELFDYMIAHNYSAKAYHEPITDRLDWRMIVIPSDKYRPIVDRFEAWEWWRNS